MKVTGILITIVVSLSMAGTAVAQTEPGVVDAYHTVDPSSGVEEGAYPELGIEDLRKITRYSGLKIKGSKCVIADRKYMRSIQPDPRDKEVLIVSGDRHRFSVLKNASIRDKRISKRNRANYGFLWIRYESKEELQGRTWTKDLLLVPYDSKTGKLSWPYGHMDPDLFIDIAGRSRRLGASAPKPEDSVVGTFDAGKKDYLVLSVFGEYSWWGKVTHFEHIALRGKGKDVVDAYHAKPPKNRKAWTSTPLVLRGLSWRLQLAAAGGNGTGPITGAVPSILDLKRADVVTKGFEDLLVLEGDNKPIQKIDALLPSDPTFRELLQWASEYYEDRDNSAYLIDWHGELGEAMAKKEKSYITSVRVLRYAFRRSGFPTRIVGYHVKKPEHPRIAIQIYFPGKNISWSLVLGQRTHAVYEASHAVLETLPQFDFTKVGTVPVFDITMGGDMVHAPPTPW